MSQHPSLRNANEMMAKKSVMKRFERIEALKKKGKWKAGDSIYGLPKTKIVE